MTPTQDQLKKETPPQPTTKEEWVKESVIKIHKFYRDGRTKPSRYETSVITEVISNQRQQAAEEATKREQVRCLEIIESMEKPNQEILFDTDYKSHYHHYLQNEATNKILFAIRDKIKEGI